MAMRAGSRRGDKKKYVLAIGFALVAAGPICVRPATRNGVKPQSTSSPSGVNQPLDVEAWFAKGQTALQAGDLDVAEAAFRQVLSVDPRAGSAYANLGVIDMRRKEWDRAIALLRKAEKLEPKMAGIRLNIGLVEYRRGNYAAAIPPFTSVLRDRPDRKSV